MQVGIFLLIVAAGASRGVYPIVTLRRVFRGEADFARDGSECVFGERAAVDAGGAGAWEDGGDGVGGGGVDALGGRMRRGRQHQQSMRTKVHAQK